MKARDIISHRSAEAGSLPVRNVTAETSMIDVFPLLLDTEDHRLGVTEKGEMLGIIDSESLLKGLSSLITPRDDSSVVVVEMPPSAYSASRLAHAVEDADVHIVDLWSSPASCDIVRVTMRVRTSDPSGVVSSLERYGYEVVEASGEENRNLDTAIERLLSLNTILKV